MMIEKFNVKGIHLFITIILGGIIYIAILWLFGAKELKVASSYIANRFLNKNTKD